ncbi:zinc-dependent alcohol dehydrogenase family protein [Pseudoalteromonas shioyasakiensis]|uniref:zinc-dependent alcohol dehydrogenase family protein n=1 Tax=Pseudoalteromonas shioyasakiensis TaxID=1190813 RepID=UPI0021196236|nr:zinc-dependent alcohol dehydrogenase family protein [Pseudoalteromonas shioyasakiensis]MCQ8878015.1 zinc-dependent alcohol dehydrogenase family protein [Pseudoalteromonas shioyasakiensis]
MKAMIINEFGNSDVFTAAEIANPQVKAGHVVIEVAATSVNTVDMMIREMGEALAPLSPALPGVLGMDFAGTITEVGEGVTKFAVGDEVYGCAGGLADLQGALAQHMLADERLIAHKPKTLSMREAAAIPLVGITAYEGLVRAGVSKGQNVLVHGGAGGVGHIALQLAKHFGANVFTTVGADSQFKLMEKLGATAINYRTEQVADYVAKHTQGNGFDVVFDSVGGANISNSFEAAALNGQIATTVAMLDLDLTPAHFKGLSLHVVFMLIPMLHNFKRQQHGDILTELAKIVDAGELTPIVDANEFSLELVGKAHDHLASGKALGKVVIDV